MSASSWIRALLASVIFASFPASAHRLDEYLQAARIDIAPDQVSVFMELTPGATIAEAVIGRIDQNKDGALSYPEQRTYALSVLHDLHVEVDHAARSLQLFSLEFPAAAALRQGEGIIRIQASTRGPGSSPGNHYVLFRNAHRLPQSVYLANALVPKNPDVQVVAQRRNAEQSELAIEYIIR